MKYFGLFIWLGLGLICRAQSNINYLESPHDFPNPERGFYRYSATYASNYIFLNQQTLENYRQSHSPSGANYSIQSTLVFRYFILDTFKNKPISPLFLSKMQTDFNTARLAGVKLIPRFAYTNQVNNSGCSSWICTPYGDAPKTWVLTHIQQLKPLLQTNSDVIAVLQMGFIGVWGENYYTDYFGDASQPPDYKLQDSNWLDRIEVLDSLLSVLPTNRMIQVRYPQMKQRFLYGVQAMTTADTLRFTAAYTTVDKARIGFHNDCFLASATDYGTYQDYGNSSSPSVPDTPHLKPYFAADSRYTVVGGETCADNYNPQSNCSATDTNAMAQIDLERMHYSYLNAQYNNDVNNDWVDGACMDEIKKRLGYRISLINGSYTQTAMPGQQIQLDVQLNNTGYAAPFNSRRVEVVLIHTLTQQQWTATLSDDPRFWIPKDSQLKIQAQLCLPNNIPLGAYDWYLNLPDPMPSLSQDPRYSIRLASLLPDSSELWDSAKGYNRLGAVLDVNNSHTGAACNGQSTFTSSSLSSANFPSNSIRGWIQLYPNPAHRSLNISYHQIDKKTVRLMTVHTINGQQVMRVDAAPNKLDIRLLAKGVYVLTMHSSTERQFYKIIKY